MRITSTKLASLLVTAVIGVVTTSALAGNGPVGTTGTVGQNGPASAEYKITSPHLGPDGRYFTYKYFPIRGSTMASCQRQVQIISAQVNTTITKYCTMDNGPQ